MSYVTPTNITSISSCYLLGNKGKNFALDLCLDL